MLFLETILVPSRGAGKALPIDPSRRRGRYCLLDMSLLMGLLRFLLVLVVLRFVGRAIAYAVRRASSSPARRPAEAPPQATADVLVRDRVCNTFVPKSRALRAVVAGHEEFFCSAACRDRAGARAS